MTVTVRKYKRGGWEVDIVIRGPDGRIIARDRKKAPVSTKRQSQRWGEAREIVLLGLSMEEDSPGKEVATLAEFEERFLEGHILACNQKKSSEDSAKSILKKHLRPTFGKVRLDQIDDEAVLRLTGRMLKKNYSPKTINNVLSTLSMLLKTAVRFKVIREMPCTITMLRVPPSDFIYYEVDQYEDLVDAAKKLDDRIHVMVLLGGDAGLRLSEILGLEWPDIDLMRGSLRVERGEVRGKVDSPKNNRMRRVPLTIALQEALRKHRHLRGSRVLCHEDGTSLSPQTAKTWMQRATRRAGLEVSGKLHPLRHTFCSHLAMRGAPAKAIQELAGHADLSTTMRYMHLSPKTLDESIRLLDSRSDGEFFGDILETAK